MSEKFDVNDALTIKKHSLDYEWLRQSHLLEKATSILADITYKRDRAKSKLAYESAKLGNYIRSNKKEMGIEGNATDSKVKELVTVDQAIVDLEEEYHDWEAEVIAANGVRRSLEHKKTGLEELTRLFLSGYWAKPYIAQEDKEKYREESNKDDEHLSTNARMMKRAKLKEK